MRHRRLRDRLRSRLAGTQGSAIMPITPYLKGPYYFDLETRRALGIALEMACIALSTGEACVARTALLSFAARKGSIRTCTTVGRRSSWRRARNGSPALAVNFTDTKGSFV